MSLKFSAEGYKWLDISSTANNLDHNVEWNVPIDLARRDRLSANTLDWYWAFLNRCWLKCINWNKLPLDGSNVKSIDWYWIFVVRCKTEPI